MKTLRALILALFVLGGVAVSAAPILAASRAPLHPATWTLQDDEPTPTPTPHLVHPNMPSPCSGGC